MSWHVGCCSGWQIAGGVVGAVVVGDLGSKWLVDQMNAPVTINMGISFGLFSSMTTQWWSVATLLMLLLLLMLGWQFWSKNPIIFGLLFGGGLANSIDRILTGGVRDWLPIPGTELHNNLADWAIALGMILFFWVVLMRGKPTDRIVRV